MDGATTATFDEHPYVEPPKNVDCPQCGTHMTFGGFTLEKPWILGRGHMNLYFHTRTTGRTEAFTPSENTNGYRCSKCGTLIVLKRPAYSKKKR